MTHAVRRRNRIAGWIADAGLTLAALAGVVCLAFALAAAFFDVSVVLFRTGSMSPSIPAGSAAIVREVPASEVSVGDIVTVERPGQLPITHRVVSVTPAGDHWDLVLRGDANPTNDPSAYSVERVQLVVAAAPGVASLVDSFQNPLVLAGVTLVAALLVLWTFWPREAPIVSVPHPFAARRTFEPEPAQSALLGLAMVALVAGGLPATIDEEFINGTYVTLHSIQAPDAMQSLTPGDIATWYVGVWSVAPEPGILAVSLTIDSDTPAAFAVRVRACNVAWVADTCSAATFVPVAWRPVESGDELVLADMPQDALWYFAVDIELVPSAPPGEQYVASARVNVLGASEELGVGTTLSDTGAKVDAVVLVAIWATVFGWVLLIATFSRKRIAEQVR